MDYLAKKNELKSLKEDLKCAYDGIKPDVLRNKVAELEAEQNADGFWNDVQNAQKVSKEISQIKAKLERFEKLLAVSVFKAYKLYAFRRFGLCLVYHFALLVYWPFISSTFWADNSIKVVVFGVQYGQLQAPDIVASVFDHTCFFEALIAYRLIIATAVKVAYHKYKKAVALLHIL